MDAARLREQFESLWSQGTDVDRGEIRLFCETLRRLPHSEENLALLREFLEDERFAVLPFAGDESAHAVATRRLVELERASDSPWRFAGAPWLVACLATLPALALMARDSSIDWQYASYWLPAAGFALAVVLVRSGVRLAVVAGVVASAGAAATCALTPSHEASGCFMIEIPWHTALQRVAWPALAAALLGFAMLKRPFSFGR